MTVAPQEIDGIVAEVMSQVLGLPVAPAGNMAMGDCEAWDSLKHIELIVTLEERFEITFEGDRLPELTSQALFAEYVRQSLRHA